MQWAARKPRFPHEYQVTYSLKQIGELPNVNGTMRTNATSVLIPITPTVRVVRATVQFRDVFSNGVKSAFSIAYPKRKQGILNLDRELGK